MISKLSFSFLKRRVNFALKIDKDRTEWIGGIGNRCEGDGEVLYVPFLDYDDVPYDYVLDEIRFIQHKFFLSDAYVFRSGGGFHVIFLDKMPLGVMLSILDNTTCDKNYRDVPLLYGRKVWVLRQTNKNGVPITFLEKVESIWSGMNKSTPHAKFINAKYGNVVDMKRGTFDKCKELYTASYYIRPS